ncbi:hypothetical protein ACFXTH_001524 [Malus domestica]
MVPLVDSGVIAPTQVGRDFQDRVKKLIRAQAGRVLTKETQIMLTKMQTGPQDCMLNDSLSGRHDMASIGRPSMNNHGIMSDGSSGPSLLNDVMPVNNAGPSSGLPQVHNIASGLEG